MPCSGLRGPPARTRRGPHGGRCDDAYIALQLTGAAHRPGNSPARARTRRKYSTLCAFLILCVYDYSSGLRAPALIAFVKDTMIYIVVIAAVAVIPLKLGGYGAVFES